MQLGPLQRAEGGEVLDISPQVDTPPCRAPVPANTNLSRCLRNGHLAATFSNVEPIFASGGGSGGAFSALHRLEGVWYTLEFTTITGLQEHEDVGARAELSKVRCLGSLLNSRHVVRYVTAWCEEPLFLPVALGRSTAPACPQRSVASAEKEPAERTQGYSVVLVVQTEKCQGVTLRTWLDAQPSQSEQPRGVASDPRGVPAGLCFVEHLAKACKELHKAGLVHRDLQPQNLLVVPSGRSTVLKVGSLGLACDTSSGAAGREDGSIPVSGSQGMAADILAVAIVALELLSPPDWDAAERAAGLQAFLFCGEVPPHTEDRLPGHAALLRRMAAPRAEERPGAVEVLGELKRLRAEASAVAM